MILYSRCSRKKELTTNISLHLVNIWTTDRISYVFNFGVKFKPNSMLSIALNEKNLFIKGMTVIIECIKFRVYFTKNRNRKIC